MDFTQLPMFRLIARRMDFLHARQQVLAQNIANSDTPGYAAKDIEVKTFGQLIATGAPALPVAKTDPAHLTSKQDMGRFEMRQVTTKDSTLSGNGVELQKELMKVSETSMDYQIATNIYKKQIGLFRMILGRPQA